MLTGPRTIDASAALRLRSYPVMGMELRFGLREEEVSAHRFSTKIKQRQQLLSEWYNRESRELNRVVGSTVVVSAMGSE